MHITNKSIECYCIASEKSWQLQICMQWRQMITRGKTTNTWPSFILYRTKGSKVFFFSGAVDSGYNAARRCIQHFFSLYFVVFRYSNLDSSDCRWTLFDLIYCICYWKPVKWQTWRTKPRYVNIGQSVLRFQASGVGHINAPLHSLTHWFLLGDKAIHLNASFFKLIIRNSSLGTCCEIDLMSMPKSLTADLSILVQVMAWCRHTTSHCLSQYWPRSVSPYGVTTAL